MVTESLNKIVETNILLSGLGFESGGLAAAHAIHNGMTVLPGTHHYLHGEKVAFATLAQLVLEDAETAELHAVLDFMAAIGLPLTLADLGVPSITFEEALEVAKSLQFQRNRFILCHSQLWWKKSQTRSSSLIALDRPTKIRTD